jgi:hypothetical protein
LLAGGGLGAKVAVGAVTVGVIAGGAVATHELEQRPAPHRQHVVAAAAPLRVIPPAGELLSAPPSATLNTSAHRSVHTASGIRQRAPAHRTAADTSKAATGQQREPGGFAYLGVPTTTSAPSAQARVASASEGQSGGGPFSP